MDTGFAGYSIGALCFLILTLILMLILLKDWRGRLQGALPVLASAVTAVWLEATASHAEFRVPDAGAVALLEVLRNAAWFGYLFKLLTSAAANQSGMERRLRALVLAGYALCSALALLVLARHYGPAPVAGLVRPGVEAFGYFLVVVVGLALVEQLLRNTSTEHRGRIKLLCLGVGGMFVYDFLLYSDALLFQQFAANLQDARGGVNALAAPLIAATVVHNPRRLLGIRVSRPVVLYTATFLGAAAYLAAIGAIRYYVRTYGGDWGRVAEIMLLFGAFMVLLLLITSRRLRARFKVFLRKHFLSYKYDYREEWRRFIHVLSVEQDGSLQERVVRAIAQIIESPGGMLWMRQGAGQFVPVARWNMPALQDAAEPSGGSLVRFLEQSRWVINLEEYAHRPEHYQGLDLPQWLQDLPQAWLIVPLLVQEKLLGFVVLQRSPISASFDWEDSDLLKTAGCQAAGHLMQQEAAQALAEARQFEAFNRLSAFVIHDLKNLTAQLSLVASNAARHKHKPAFIDDAVCTIEHSVAKMNRLLAQLHNGGATAGRCVPVELAELLRAAIRNRSATQPVPELAAADEGVRVVADPDRLTAVLEHIIANAQEAAPHGHVTIRLWHAGERAIVEVEDDGCGMDEVFVRERLFRPFDTTKGSAGMGIGAYESRELARSLGGDVEVRSEPGRGTVFRILLPAARRDEMPRMDNKQCIRVIS